MSKTYDENISKNHFFQSLQLEYQELFRRAVAEKWIICVPCSESLINCELNEKIILNHILLPSEELPDTHFYTVNNLEVCISNGYIKTYNSSLPQHIPILFTETFYVDDHLKYDILCIERPIGSNTAHPPDLSSYFIQSLRDCVSLLFSESSNGETLIERVDETVTQFLDDNLLSLMPSDLLNSSIHDLYNDCLKLVISDTKIGKKCESNRNFLNNVKVSVESYILHYVYPVAMESIITDLTDEIGKFNKIIRSVADIQIQHIHINEELAYTIPKARNELSHIDRYSTVLGKFSCLKKALNEITRIAQSKNPNNLIDNEIMPIMIFLIIKSGLPNWLAQLKYMTNYRFSSSEHFADEFSFLCATLEAAITFINSDEFYHTYFSNVQINEVDLNVNSNLSSGVFNVSKILYKTNNLAMRKVFTMIYNDNVDGVKNLLDESANLIGNRKLQHCHLSCSCDICEKLRIEDNMESKIRINMVNDAGLTMLHFASLCGRCLIVDILLHKGASPEVTDFLGLTPLHYAAEYGRQNTLLLLMYARAKINEQNNEGNTPLHLACSNGHEDCVKALLYFAEHSNIAININCKNREGDTPLHLSSRWYYRNIVKILLTYNANPLLKNKHQLTSADITQSRSILHLMKDSFSNDFPVPATYYEKLELMDFSDEVKIIHLEKYGMRPATLYGIKQAEKFMKAVKNDDLNSIKYYLGFDAPFSVAYKCHPLCQCEECLSIEISEKVRLGEKFGYNRTENLNINVCNSEGFTALHLAASLGKEKILKFLLDKKAELNVRTYKELSTPLLLACQNQHVNIADLLVNSPTCKIDLYDVKGNTALHYACIFSNVHLVKIILKGKPKLDIKNDKGKTPLKEAEENFSFSIVQLLSTNE